MPFTPIILSLLPASKPRSRRFHSAPLRVGVARALPPAPPIAHAKGRVVPPDRAASRNVRFRDDSESSRQSLGCAPPGDALVGSRGAPASSRRFLSTAESGMLCRPLEVSWPSIGALWSSSSATRKLHLPEGEAGTAISQRSVSIDGTRATKVVATGHHPRPPCSDGALAACLARACPDTRALLSAPRLAVGVRPRLPAPCRHVIVAAGGSALARAEIGVDRACPRIWAFV